MESSEEILEHYAMMLERHGGALAMGLLAGRIIGTASGESRPQTQLAAGLRGLEMLGLHDAENAAAREQKLRDLVNDLVIANSVDDFVVDSDHDEPVVLNRSNVQSWREAQEKHLIECASKLKPWDMARMRQEAWQRWFVHFREQFAAQPRTMADAQSIFPPAAANFVCGVGQTGPEATPLRNDVAAMSIAEWSQLVWRVLFEKVSDPGEPLDRLAPDWIAVVACLFLGLRDSLDTISTTVQRNRSAVSEQYEEMLSFADAIEWGGRRNRVVLVVADGTESQTALWPPTSDLSALWLNKNNQSDKALPSLLRSLGKVDIALIERPDRHIEARFAKLLESNTNTVIPLDEALQTELATRKIGEIASIEDILQPLILKTM